MFKIILPYKMNTKKDRFIRKTVFLDIYIFFNSSLESYINYLIHFIHRSGNNTISNWFNILKYHYYIHPMQFLNSPPLG